jgi:predicted DNA-binding transcriptional regulator AlpA
MTTKQNPSPDQRPIADLLVLPSTAWISPKEAAALLGISTDALATRRSRGDWPRAIKLGPRLTRYRLGEILRIEPREHSGSVSDARQ